MPIAQNNLGLDVSKWFRTRQTYQEAFKWYQQAANQGYAIAQNILGWMYENGIGVNQYYQEAFKWYQQAATKDIATAQYKS